MTTFSGCYTALATPFLHGRLDPTGLERLLRAQIEGEVDGVVLCGTTGESPTLTDAEFEQAVGLAVESCRGKITVIANAGGNDTARSVERTRRAASLGADALMAVTPYYNRPTQEGLFRHFAALAEATDRPLMLYNVPSRTGVNLAPATVARLARVPNVAGIKEASGDLRQMSDIVRQVPDGFSLLSGDDFLTWPVIAIGGRGVVSVVSNVAPRDMAALVRTALAGGMADARDIHYRLLDLAQALFVEPNPVPVKAALQMMGMISGELRLPLAPLSDEKMEELRRVLAGHGLV